MSYPKIFALCAGCAISASVVSAAPSYTGQQSGYNDLLVTPAPYPGNTVDSPSRAENGRVWHSRAIGEHQTLHSPGAAAYGAPASEEDRLIYVRVNHIAVAISPWDRLDQSGFEDLEHARNVWLRANGYVQHVRTFVNPRYVQDDEAVASSDSTLPKPRATIRRHFVPKGPSEMQVMRPISGQPIARISKPGEVVATPESEIADAGESTGN